jgi:predicted Co/Zn/Cd cation transporter (cation efflux family)
VLSAVVLAGTLLVLLVRLFSSAAQEQYVDPVLVLVASLLLVREPVRMVRTMVVELLEGAPGPELLGLVREAAGQWDIADEDRVRRALAERLAALQFDVWLNVEVV